MKNKNRFCINVIVLFTQIMWFHVMGMTTLFQVRTNDFYSERYSDNSLIR
jgi:hypothetical protein